MPQPSTPSDGPPPTTLAARLDWYLEQPRLRSPMTVLAYALEVGGGKFTASFGASMLVEGALTDDRALIAGGACTVAAGIALFVSGALHFTAAARKVDPIAAPRFKILSLTGGAVLVGAYACLGAKNSGQLANGFPLEMCYRVLDYSAVTAMYFSFCSFVVLGQAVYGDILPEPRRKHVGYVMLATGIYTPKLIPSPPSPSRATNLGLLFLSSALALYTLVGAALVTGHLRPLWFHRNEGRDEQLEAGLTDAQSSARADLTRVAAASAVLHARPNEVGGPQARGPRSRPASFDLTLRPPKGLYARPRTA